MAEALISRREATELIDLLMDTDGPKQMRRKPGRPGPKSRRFGRCELAELLDAIYGREEVRNDHREENEIIEVLERLAG
ncbi:MAG: hypothetical protein OXT06_12735 [Rhodospirillaceae bacterium]|nr:hypothetical protein [Rhodospirillaceae bacterium]MDD9914057.1 hypothetical protein [Rhodospirillaceae bacterium]MDD9926420.1 hypothetical protein [Rhodospirillaceae bacterium]